MVVAKKAAKKGVKKVVKKGNKRPSRKIITDCVFRDGVNWTVQYGELKRSQGRPSKEQHLFKVAGEKLPFESEDIQIRHHAIGRGNVFARLKARKKAQPLELHYYSFYIVSQKQHEREVETLLIRAASFLLEFNDKKRRVGLSAGAINDYEPGMFFYERQHKKGKKR